MSNTMFFTLTDWGTIRKQNNLFEGLKKKKKKMVSCQTYQKYHFMLLRKKQEKQI